MKLNKLTNKAVQ